VHLLSWTAWRLRWRHTLLWNVGNFSVNMVWHPTRLESLAASVLKLKILHVVPWQGSGYVTLGWMLFSYTVKFCDQTNYSTNHNCLSNTLFQWQCIWLVFWWYSIKGDLKIAPVIWPKVMFMKLLWIIIWYEAASNDRDWGSLNYSILIN
jgi:hypothetical protein